jgi:Alcohol dehydrogenase GroES-like domain
MIGRDPPAPGSREVRLRVAASGVCHSDSVTVQGLMPGTTYPRVPGHEVSAWLRRSEPTRLAGTWACGSVCRLVRWFVRVMCEC